MLRWKQFLEAKEKECEKTLEKAEEDTGIDLDNDDEKGEPKDHADKVKFFKKKKK